MTTPLGRKLARSRGAHPDAPLNQFLIQSAYKEARQILDEETRIQLTSAQAEQVFSLIENPPKPNTRLLRSARSLKARVRVHA